jgi:mevalonate kinase
MISVPSKIFLLGEYAVLAGAPAWVSAVSPRFELRDGATTRFHPESPAGKYLAGQGRSEVTGSFVDPWEGRGGFGGSTAEFAVAAYQEGVRSPLDAWRAYRELSRNEAPSRRPSGADLIAQWSGGTVEWDPKSEKVTDLSAELEGFPVLIFSATHLPNRKTVTHSHLETLASSSLSFESLLPSLARAREGLLTKKWTEVGHAFSAYADSLAHLGLEAPVVRNERLAISRQSGVIGVKGCGSLQTDAMLVVVNSLTSPETERVIAFAADECSLRLLARGLTREPGIREESR